MLEFLVALKSLFMALIVSVSIIDCNDVTYDEETINEGVEIANREECVVQYYLGKYCISTALDNPRYCIEPFNDVVLLFYSSNDYIIVIKDDFDCVSLNGDINSDNELFCYYDRFKETLPNYYDFCYYSLMHNNVKIDYTIEDNKVYAEFNNGKSCYLGEIEFMLSDDELVLTSGILIECDEYK